jgi:type IV pilus assembly protein PilM
MRDLTQRYPIAIDIDDQNIYAAQFQESRQGISIRELFHGEPGNGETDGTEPDGAMLPVLKEIAKNRRFRGKSAAIHIPPQHVYSIPITFEVGMDETVEEAIVRESRKYLSFPLEEAVIDYPFIHDVSSGPGKKFKANIIAVRREHIKGYVHLLKRAGLSLEVIDFSLSSLLRLHHYLYAVSDGLVILCNIGHRQSLLSTVTKDSILATRDVAWGIGPLSNSLEVNLEIPRESQQAAEMLRKYGLFYEGYTGSSGGASPEGNGGKKEDVEIYRTVFQILTPHVDELIHELHQIMGYVRSETKKAKFEEIYMYGQASLINFLGQYLEKRLSIPTKCINPISKLTLSHSSLVPDAAGAAPFAQALGLAMRKVRWL